MFQHYNIETFSRNSKSLKKKFLHFFVDLTGFEPVISWVKARRVKNHSTIGLHCIKELIYYNIELIFKNSKSQIKKNPKEFFVPPDFQCIYSVLISLCNENPEAAIFILSFFILHDYICISLLHLFD